MKYKLGNFLNNRKTLYLVFGIVLVSVFTLTIAYAALNTVLKINGNAEVSSASWDVYLDNVQLISGSSTTTKPIITDKTTASFSTILTNPGDYYMFTIDVVNKGSIDAMIDSIEKLPQLSESQAKYLNYIVEYQNGESINTKQLVKANSFVRLKVKVEFRKDINSSDLPVTTETLNLSFTLKYIQAEEGGTSNILNNGKLVKVVSGDYDTVGSEICIDTECFYVISSTDEDVTMLSKYNLYVGNINDCSGSINPIENSIGIQDETAKGWFSGCSSSNQIVGVLPFSNTNYWNETVINYPAYVYDENSYYYEYVENYKKYFEKFDLFMNETRLITIEELDSLGCRSAENTCGYAPKWVYSTSYRSGTAENINSIWRVNSSSYLGSDSYTSNSYGVRPVITISKEYF